MLAGAPAVASPDGVYAAETDRPFADVKQDLADAIVNRGYKIDHKALIGDMLKRTGEAVGADKTVFRDAELVQFCSAVLSRKMMEADPANIAYCPYVIFIYERADTPGTVHVGFRKLTERGSAASAAALKTINQLLEDIVQEATNGF